ncbi:ammonia monooxygenase [Limoniibacter endophyticus]|uniref:Ammonia monooxygenase n=1 Tax=Limoniibacter endophyticus TaxID=1565040 RepID=A0A8J3GGH3_9HYPH|nr:ammonia monooxygenase [Limoniibacter endophyticus]
MPQVLFRWLLLLTLSGAIAYGVDSMGLPAALLLGPLVAGIIVSCSNLGISLNKHAFTFGQVVVGISVSVVLNGAFFSAFWSDGLLVAMVVIATVAASSLLGWLLSRTRVLPGTTGVWGSSPGAASVMVLMAGEFGADMRLVAFMQYLRVIIVTVAAAFVASLWVTPGASAAPVHHFFAPIHVGTVALTLVVALIAAYVARLLRLPAASFLGPFFFGGLLHLTGWISYEVPELLLGLSYALIGWTIGLKFERDVLLYAMRRLPHILAAIIALLLFSGSLAVLLVYALEIDLLTAYLATSPGGLDSVAIIAAASKSVDLTFVMAIQTARFLFLLAFGPAISRFVAARS